MSKTSIVLLVPYFGQWPDWFPLYLQSCRYNPDINWVFYTDCPLPNDIPDNVQFKQLSFDEYKALVSDRLGIEFYPESAYKLCDLKPMLGYVHETDVSGYGFWGFSDIDLVYGDLRSYYTEEKLKRYSLISTHARRVSGHFCLLRNNEKMRTAFMKIKNWKDRLEDQKHFALDESAFSRIFIRHKNFPKPLFNFFAKLNPWRRNSEFAEAFTTPNAGVAWRDGSYVFPAEWYWHEGVVNNSFEPDSSYPYFHFFKWKTIWKGDFIQPLTEPDKSGFVFSEKGILVSSDS